MSKNKKATKQNLKTMSKSSNIQKARSSSRILKYGAIGFTRNIWLSVAATLVMIVTLVILFITVIASVILAGTADTMREKIDITIYFEPGTYVTTLSNMANTMRSEKNVKSVEISTSEEEYQKMIEENKNNKDIMQTLEDETMRELMISGMDATMRIKVFDVNDLSGVKNIVNTDRDFLIHIDSDKLPTYDVNRTEIETITSWANIARNGGIILSIVFLAISILVIFNTIRMAIFSRREEIYMMKLVGADNNFIRGPFLIEAQISGVIAGVTAATIGYFGFHILAPHLERYGIDVSTINNILESKWLVLVYVVTILIGILIGTISSTLAIRKYLSTKKSRRRKRN